MNGVDGMKYGAGLTPEQRLARLEQLLIPKSIGEGLGDMIGFDADGLPVRLPAAAGDGYVRTSDIASQGGAKWAGPALGRVYKTADVNIGDGVETQITGFTQEYETNSAIVDVDAANSKIIAKRAGFYRLHYQGMYATSTTDIDGYFALKIGSVYALVTPFINMNGVYQPGNGNSDVVQLAANDEVKMYTYWDYGAAGTYTLKGADRWATWFSVEYIGPA